MFTIFENAVDIDFFGGATGFSETQGPKENLCQICCL